MTSPLRNDPLPQRMARIRMLLLDVDGVLTDGRLYHFPDSGGKMVETKGFSAQDGIALRWLADRGFTTGVISGRESLATEERARQVGISLVYQGHHEKIPILEEIFAKTGIPASQTAYVGDDLTDVVVMRRVAVSFAPANARAEVKEAADITLESRGGDCAVRDAIESILKAQGYWDEILRHYEAY